MALPAVPAIPDAERVTFYTPTTATTFVDVDFPIYGAADLQVWVNGVERTTAWSYASRSGAAYPYSDGRVTFAVPLPTIGDEVVIVGARRPLTEDNFVEGGSTARQRQIAHHRHELTLREIFDQLARTARVPPGEYMTVLAPAGTRANKYAIFDADGDLTHGGAPAVSVGEIAYFDTYASAAATNITGAGTTVTTIIFLGRLARGDFDGWVPAHYSATVPSHPGYVQSADGAYWELRPSIWTVEMASSANNAAAAAYATSTPMLITSGTATLTIDPVAEAASDTDTARQAVINNASAWQSTCLIGGNGFIEILITGTGAIKVQGQVVRGLFSSPGFATTPVLFRMPFPTPIAITGISYGTKYAGITHCSFTVGGSGLSGSTAALTIDSVTSTNTVSGFAATGTIVGGVLQAVVVTNRGTGADAGTVDFDWSAQGKSPCHITVTEAAGAITGVTIVDAGSGFTSAPTVTLRDTGRSSAAIDAVITLTLTGDAVTGYTIVEAGTEYTSPTAVVTGGGHPVVTAVVNQHIVPTTVTLASSVPAGAGAYMPVGIRNVVGDNDAGNICGAQLLTGASGNEIYFDLTSPRLTALSNPTTITSATNQSQVYFPSTWLQLRGGFTGLTSGSEGYWCANQGARIQMRGICMSWDDTATDYGYKSRQQAIHAGILGGSFHIFGNDCIFAGFPGGVMRLVNCGPSYINFTMMGCSPFGDDVVTIQNGGFVQLATCDLGGSKSSVAIAGAGCAIQMSGRMASGVTGAYAPGGRFTYRSSKIHGCTTGAQAEYGGICDGLTGTTINRCSYGIEFDAGGIVVQPESLITNSITGTTQSYLADSIARGGAWISDFGNTDMAHFYFGSTGTNGPSLHQATGSPAGVITAGFSSLYLQRDDDRLWIKTTSSGTTGWHPVMGYVGSATLNLDNAVANTCAIAQVSSVDATITVTGATTAMIAQVYYVGDAGGLTFPAWVSAADTVKFRTDNGTGSDINLANGTFYAIVRPVL